MLEPYVKPVILSLIVAYVAVWLIEKIIEWWHDQDYCQYCGSKLLTHGYPEDEKRSCPNRCVWKNYLKEQEKLKKQ